MCTICDLSPSPAPLAVLLKSPLQTEALRSPKRVTRGLKVPVPLVCRGIRSQRRTEQPLKQAGGAESSEPELETGAESSQNEEK